VVLLGRERVRFNGSLEVVFLSLVEVLCVEVVLDRGDLAIGIEVGLDLGLLAFFEGDCGEDFKLELAAELKIKNSIK